MTEKKGPPATCANDLGGGGGEWAQVAIFGGKAIETPNFNTGSSCHRSSEVPKNFYSRL